MANHSETTMTQAMIWKANATAQSGGGTVTLDLQTGNVFQITVSDSTAFTIGTPSNMTQGQPVVVCIENTSGGAMGAITWAGQWKLAGGSFTNPADGNNRSVLFWTESSRLYEVARSSGDVAN